MASETSVMAELDAAFRVRVVLSTVAMNASFGQRNLIDDFVLGDRRLGDIRGIKVAVSLAGWGLAAREPIQAHPMVPIQMVWRYL